MFFKALLALKTSTGFILFSVGILFCGLVLLGGCRFATPGPEAASVEVAVKISRPTAVPTFTSTPTPWPTPTVTPTLGPPTPTSTRVVPDEVYSSATAGAHKRATRQASSQATVVAQLQTPGQIPRLSSSQTGPVISSYPEDFRLVLAHYFAWYDGHGWDNCNISAGDKPLEPYHSDDPAAIAGHIQLARAAGLNGFTLHWFAPGDRTDRNFQSLLDRSRGVDFSSTIVFSRHFWHGSPRPSRQIIIESLRYLMDQYSHHPNFLRVGGTPVIFFIDMYRVPAGTGQPPQQFWAAVRDAVDPQRRAWWIAEGLDASYLSVFDGLYVFKISHATSPHDYVKSPQWGGQVGGWTDRTGRPKFWIATISPGWNDLRSTCKTDVRVPNTPHRLSRADGAVYRATFEAALKSKPDWLIVSSFNEWVEGSYIEPSLQYGDKYMEMTRRFVAEFQQGR